ncbi:hypothetical protein DEO72_LG3g816 [Vigna unguiculata]|uniref:Uncharacterized protein n=1 Tax=Vigna unguiculata TaxID=3917 RepID=A0A4D6LD83_VIGUN|nr:hypothetical protein DEO72_LG3g816 [Vigna unguiculata]
MAATTLPAAANLAGSHGTCTSHPSRRPPFTFQHLHCVPPCLHLRDSYQKCAIQATTATTTVASPPSSNRNHRWKHHHFRAPIRPHQQDLRQPSQPTAQQRLQPPSPVLEDDPDSQPA